jgi:uncharacterized protein
MPQKILMTILVIAGVLWCRASLADPSSTQPTNQPASTGSEICDAARDGDLEKVKAMLKDNPGLVSSKDTDGESPLYWAVLQHHKDVAALLLANKADVNVTNNVDGWTPLHHAAYLPGLADMAELLLANKADVNAVTSAYSQSVFGGSTIVRVPGGYTPLHLAAQQGNIDVAELLLANKADVNAKSDNGQTPTYLAKTNDHKDVADLLRQHGGHE